jgi:hypothetical protein
MDRGRTLESAWGKAGKRREQRLILGHHQTALTTRQNPAGKRTRCCGFILDDNVCMTTLFRTTPADKTFHDQGTQNTAVLPGIRVRAQPIDVTINGFETLPPLFCNRCREGEFVSLS